MWSARTPESREPAARGISHPTMQQHNRCYETRTRMKAVAIDRELPPDPRAEASRAARIEREQGEGRRGEGRDGARPARSEDTRVYSRHDGLRACVHAPQCPRAHSLTSFRGLERRGGAITSDFRVQSGEQWAKRKRQIVCGSNSSSSFQFLPPEL